jgi:GNAT superfamily N-acetyltransferase
MNQPESRITVQRIESLDEDLLAPLVKQSAAEGYRHLERLVDDWKSGTNRFDRENEALFVATCADAASDERVVDPSKPNRVGTPRSRSEVAWVGIVGVNVDPYLDDPAIGRVRRLYVDPAFRRAGVGRKLVERVIDHARGRFRRLVLRTTPEAKAFYEEIGFEPDPSADHHTHALFLPDTMEVGKRHSGVTHGVPGSTLVSDRWRDQVIQDALQQGAFRDLPGTGKPLSDLNDDPDWWVKDKLRREGISVVPPAIQLRQELARMREEINQLSSEEQARRRIEEMNVKICAANRSITTGPPSDLAPLDVEEELARWRSKRA